MTARSAEDTTPEVVNLLSATLRAMSPIERVRIADQLSVDVATIAKAGIRARNPGITESALRHQLARRRYGPLIADAAFHRSRDT